MSLKERTTAWFVRGILEALRDKKLNVRTRVALWAAQRWMDKMMNGSWKTSAAGIAGILTGLGAIATMVAKVMHDGFGSVDQGFIQGFAAAVGSVSVGVGLLFARDNDKSSEDVGTK